MNRPEKVIPEPGAGSRRRNQLGQAMGAKGIQTRRRLLEATETLLNATPLRELRVAQIVRLAGTSAATFYVYFNDVSEAVLALIGELSQSPPNMLALIGEPWRGEGALDRAHEFVAAYVEHWQTHAAAFRVRNLASDEGDGRFSQLRIAAVSPLLGAIAERIAARQAAGGLPQDLHPPSTAGALLALVERIGVLPLMATGKGVTRPRLLSVAAFFAVLLLGEDGEPAVGLTPPRRGRDALAAAGRTGEVAAVNTSGLDRTAPALVNLHGQAMGPKGARTRQRILEATETLLSTRSLLELSVADIAKQAQISTSTFYLYFQDVPQALLAVIGTVSQTTPELVALLEGDWDGPDRRERGYRFVRGYAEHWHENRAVLRARNLVSDEGDERFIRARAASVEVLLEILTRQIASRKARGALPAELHPRSAAGAFLAMIERLSATPNLKFSDATVETVSRTAGYLLNVLMHGYPP